MVCVFLNMMQLKALGTLKTMKWKKYCKSMNMEFVVKNAISSYKILSLQLSLTC